VLRYNSDSFFLTLPRGPTYRDFSVQYINLNQFKHLDAYLDLNLNWILIKLTLRVHAKEQKK